MRTPWPILLLLTAGCQSIPNDAVGHRSLTGEAQQVTTRDARPTPSTSSARIMVVPAAEAESTDRATGPLLVELPPGWDTQTQPTVVVVPVRNDVAPLLPDASAPQPAKSGASQEPVNSSDDEVLDRLKTIETAVQALVARVEEIEELPAEPAAERAAEPPTVQPRASQIVDARELPYQVGFLK